MCFQFPKKFGCLFHISARIIISSEIETQHDRRRDEANSRERRAIDEAARRRRGTTRNGRRGEESLFISNYVIRAHSLVKLSIEWIKKDWISSHRYPKTWYTTEEIQLFFCLHLLFVCTVHLMPACAISTTFRSSRVYATRRWHRATATKNSGLFPRGWKVRTF